MAGAADDPSALRASDADRAETLDALRRHTSEGRLSLDELEERSQQALGARTRAELDALLRDLPAAAPAGGEVQAASSPPPGAGTRLLLAIMGGTERAGRWRPAAEGTAVAVMGGTVLDLRAIDFDGPELTITAVAIMGGIEIVVPEGTELDVSGFALMGGKDVKVRNAPRPARFPHVRVRAFAVMGGVEIKSRPRQPWREIAGGDRGRPLRPRGQSET